MRARVRHESCVAAEAAADLVAACAGAAGVKRIVYLGGLGEVDDDSSAHLASRGEVADVLKDGAVPITVLRAAVVIGSGSASFEMLRHLTEKLPFMVCPRWIDTRVQPIAIRDVLRYLIAAMDTQDTASHDYDIGGPDVLTYREMMQRYAAVAGLRKRAILTVPALTPTLSSYWVNVVTPVPFGLAKPLVQSLSVDVVVRDGHETGQDLDPEPCLPYETAVRLALQRVADREVETSWRDAALAGRSPAEPYPGDPEWSGGVLLRDVEDQLLILLRVRRGAPLRRADVRKGLAVAIHHLKESAEGLAIIRRQRDRCREAPRGIVRRRLARPEDSAFPAHVLAVGVDVRRKGDVRAASE